MSNVWTDFVVPVVVMYGTGLGIVVSVLLMVAALRRRHRRLVQAVVTRPLSIEEQREILLHNLMDAAANRLESKPNAWDVPIPVDLLVMIARTMESPQAKRLQSLVPPDRTWSP